MIKWRLLCLNGSLRLWYGQCGSAIDDCLRLNCCHVMVCEIIRGQLTHKQKHNAHTSHALENIRQNYWSIEYRSL